MNWLLYAVACGCLARAACQVAGVGAPMPISTFNTVVRYVAADGVSALDMAAWQGERGPAQQPGYAAFYTSRMDILLPSSSNIAGTTISNVNVLYKNNNTARRVTFWSMAEPEQSEYACAGTSTLPVPWEALHWDWLNDGSGGALTNLGNATIDSPLLGNVTAAHWRAAATCRDAWLVSMFLLNLPASASPYPGILLQAPVLYTIADSASSPACDVGVQHFFYANVTLLNTSAAAQTSALFLIPPACNAATAPAGGGDGTPPGSVPAVWLGVGLAIAAVVCCMMGFLLGRHTMNKQWHRHAATVTNYRQPLLDTL